MTVVLACRYLSTSTTSAAQPDDGYTCDRETILDKCDLCVRPVRAHSTSHSQLEMYGVSVRAEALYINAILGPLTLYNITKFTVPMWNIYVISKICV